MTPEVALAAAGIGLAAGVLGGLAGIGGSMVMIPGLYLVLGDDERHTAQHLYMASAMVVNVLVSAPATYQHLRRGAVRWSIVRILTPSMCLAIIAGALISDRVRGDLLRTGLAVFIAAYSLMNIAGAVRRVPAPAHAEIDPPRSLLAGIGGFTGLVGGLLGIGGGVVLVPALQVLGRVRLVHAVAVSSATMTVSAAIGSATKLSTLSQHGRTLGEAAELIVGMGPAAVIGSLLGARLVHVLPVNALRMLISVLLLVAAARLAGLW